MEKNSMNEIEERRNEVEESHIPEEIITQQILPWLPIKPQTEFQLVSKDWYSLISSPQIIDKHFKLSLFSDNPNCSPIQHLLIQYGNNKFCIFDGENVVNLDTYIMFYHLFTKLGRSGGICLVGSVNGLVCLADFFGKFFILWNPAINVYHNFYPPDFELLQSSESSPSCNWGFGYVSFVNDYKTVRVITAWNGEETSVHLHSFKYNRWTKIESGFEPECKLMLSGRARVINETVYWICSLGLEIVAFDLRQEKLYKFPHLSVKSHADFLCVLGGCLGICSPTSNSTHDDLPITLYKKSGEPASVRVPSGISFCENEDMIGFTNNGMIYVARSNPDRIDLIAGPTLINTLLSLPEEGRLSIENYVPTQISPIPLENKPNAADQVSQAASVGSN